MAQVAQAERTEVTLQEETLSRAWFWVILFAVAIVLFGVFLIWKKYKKLEKRMEENELALRFQILGLSSGKDEIEEARLEFKSYQINQGQFDSMRDHYCQSLRRAIVKQNGYVEEEESMSEGERCMKFLEKGNQKWGREDGRDKTKWRQESECEETRRRSHRRGEEGAGIKLERRKRERRKSERRDNYSSTVLDDGREVEIPVEHLNAEIVPRTVDERQRTAPPPFEPPDEPEVEVEGPERSDNEVDMTCCSNESNWTRRNNRWTNRCR